MTQKLYFSPSDRFKPSLKLSMSFRRFLMETADNCIVSSLIRQGCACSGRYTATDKTGRYVMDYISYRDEKGLISFMPANRTQGIAANGNWIKDGRQTMKPAKFARTILHPRIVKKLKDHDFADFASKFKASEIENEVTFDVISVKEGYNTNYSTYIGSCMQGKRVHTFYEMFDCNVLIARRKGQNIGRAIIWNDISINGTPGKFMDRIYAATTDVHELFKNWAAENGYHRKYSQNGDPDEVLVSPEGDRKASCVLIVKKKNKAKSTIYKPYLDTLEYSSYDYGVISNTFKVTESVYWNLKSAEDFRDNHRHLIYAQFEQDSKYLIEKRSCVKYKGVYYYRLDTNIIQCITNRYSDMKYYHKSDNRIFNHSGRYYLKTQKVVIDGNIYNKDDPQVIKTKNNRWVIKEVPKVEKIEAPERVDTTSSSIMKTLQSWVTTINGSRFLQNY